METGANIADIALCTTLHFWGTGHWQLLLRRFATWETRLPGGWDLGFTGIPASTLNKQKTLRTGKQTKGMVPLARGKGSKQKTRITQHLSFLHTSAEDLPNYQAPTNRHAYAPEAQSFDWSCRGRTSQHTVS